jgi:hypothetical protein
MHMSCELLHKWAHFRQPYHGQGRKRCHTHDHDPHAALVARIAELERGNDLLAEQVRRQALRLGELALTRSTVVRCAARMPPSGEPDARIAAGLDGHGLVGETARWRAAMKRAVPADWP